MNSQHLDSSSTATRQGGEDMMSTTPKDRFKKMAKKINVYIQDTNLNDKFRKCYFKDCTYDPKNSNISSFKTHIIQKHNYFFASIQPGKHKDYKHINNEKENFRFKCKKCATIIQFTLDEDFDNKKKEEEIEKVDWEKYHFPVAHRYDFDIHRCTEIINEKRKRSNSNDEESGVEEKKNSAEESKVQMKKHISAAFLPKENNNKNIYENELKALIKSIEDSEWELLKPYEDPELDYEIFQDNIQENMPKIIHIAGHTEEIDIKNGRPPNNTCKVITFKNAEQKGIRDMIRTFLYWKHTNKVPSIECFLMTCCNTVQELENMQITKDPDSEIQNDLDIFNFGLNNFIYFIGWDNETNDNQCSKFVEKFYKFLCNREKKDDYVEAYLEAKVPGYTTYIRSRKNPTRGSGYAEKHLNPVHIPEKFVTIGKPKLFRIGNSSIQDISENIKIEKEKPAEYDGSISTKEKDFFSLIGLLYTEKEKGIFDNVIEMLSPFIKDCGLMDNFQFCESFKDIVLRFHPDSTKLNLLSMSNFLFAIFVDKDAIKTGNSQQFYINVIEVVAIFSVLCTFKPNFKISEILDVIDNNDNNNVENNVKNNCKQYLESVLRIVYSIRNQKFETMETFYSTYLFKDLQERFRCNEIMKLCNLIIQQIKVRIESFASKMNLSSGESITSNSITEKNTISSTATTKETISLTLSANNRATEKNTHFTGKEISNLKVLSELSVITNGYSWNHEKNWLLNKPLSDWDGIEINEDENSITSLDLDLFFQGGDLTLWKSIEYLSALNSLILTNNDLEGDISQWTSVIGLTQLQYLDLSINSIAGDISQWTSLEALTQLQTLNLRNTNITGDIAQWTSVKTLTQLQELNLYNTNIKGDITQWTSLAALTQLQTLNLGSEYGSTKITGDITQWTSLAALTQLQTLNLYNTNIKGDITQWTSLAALTQLQELNLRNTNITGDIAQWTSLAALTQLQTLDLENCKLQYIGEDTKFLEKIKRLELSGNPWKRPPINVVEQGLPAVKNYWKDIKEQGISFTSQLKIVMIGEGMAGKTSIMKKLENRNATLALKDDDRAICLDICRIKNEFAFWDLGGQRESHLCHQLFLTPGALYLLVVDINRFEQEENRTQQIDRWLDTLLLYLPGGNQRIGIVLIGNQKVNDIDTTSVMTELNEYVFNRIRERNEAQTKLVKNETSDKMQLVLLDSFCVNAANSKCLGMDTLDIFLGNIKNDADKYDEYRLLFPTVNLEVPKLWNDAIEMLNTLKGIDNNITTGNANSDVIMKVEHNGLISPDLDDLDVDTDMPIKTKRSRSCDDNTMIGRPRRTRHTFSSHYITWKDLSEKWSNGINNLENAVRLKERDGTILVSNKSNENTFLNDTIIHIDPKWILELLKPLLNHKLIDKQKELRKEILQHSLEDPDLYDNFWDRWEKGHIHTTHLPLTFLWGKELKERSLYNGMTEFLKQKFFFYEQDGYLLIPSRLEEEIKFYDVKETMKSFEYNDTWTKYTFFSNNVQIAEMDQLIPRMVCCGCTNYNDALLWRHGAIFNWKNTNTKVLVYVNDSFLTIYMGGKRAEIFFDFVKEMKTSLPKVIREWGNEVLEGIPTISIFQEPGFKRYFNYSVNENKSNNCIERCKSKRKALIINNSETDTETNEVEKVLNYLNFEVITFTRISSVDELTEKLEDYAVENLNEDMKNGCFLCFINSHGGMNDNIGLYGDEKEYIGIQDIIDTFCGVNYSDEREDLPIYFQEKLAMIRKLIFVDMCRGEIEDIESNDIAKAKYPNIAIAYSKLPGHSFDVGFNYFSTFVNCIYKYHHLKTIDDIINIMKKNTQLDMPVDGHIERFNL